MTGKISYKTTCTIELTLTDQERRDFLTMLKHVSRMSCATDQEDRGQQVVNQLISIICSKAGDGMR